MATQKNSTHSFGDLNSMDTTTVPEVFAGEDMENYSLVELNYVSGKRTATYLNTGEDVALLCAVEVLYDNELFTEFYVGNGEGCRVIRTEKGRRFDTSNYAQIVGTAPAEGQFASWDAAAKKFQLVATKPVAPTGDVMFKVVGLNRCGLGDAANVKLEVL